MNSLTTLCPLCEESMFFHVSTELFGNLAHLKRCKSCGSLQVINPKWLRKSYQLGMSKADTSRVSRAITSCKYICIVLSRLGLPKVRLLDFGGGEGVLVRLLRDHGFEAFNFDVNSTKDLSFGFNIEKLPRVGFNVISIIEVLEHLKEPKKSLGPLLINAELVFLSISTLPDPIPDINATPTWHYYSKQSGHHVLFPTKTGLKEFFGAYQLIYSMRFGNLFIFSKNKLSLDVRTRIKILNYMEYFRSRLNARKSSFAQRSLTDHDSQKIIEQLIKIQNIRC